jgi:hypothetical protein
MAPLALTCRPISSGEPRKAGRCISIGKAQVTAEKTFTSAEGRDCHVSLGGNARGHLGAKNFANVKARLMAIVAPMNTCFRVLTHVRQETNFCHIPDRRSG